MSFWTAIVLISLISAVASVINSRHRALAGIGQDGTGKQYRLPETADAALRGEVEALRERVKVLERIVTDERGGARAIAAEIESLRDR